MAPFDPSRVKPRVPTAKQWLREEKERKQEAERRLEARLEKEKLESIELQWGKAYDKVKPKGFMPLTDRGYKKLSKIKRLRFKIDYLARADGTQTGVLFGVVRHVEYGNPMQSRLNQLGEARYLAAQENNREKRREYRQLIDEEREREREETRRRKELRENGPNQRAGRRGASASRTLARTGRPLTVQEIEREQERDPPVTSKRIEGQQGQEREKERERETHPETSTRAGLSQATRQSASRIPYPTIKLVKTRPNGQLTYKEQRRQQEEEARSKRAYAQFSTPSVGAHRTTTLSQCGTEYGAERVSPSTEVGVGAPDTDPSVAECVAGVRGAARLAAEAGMLVLSPILHAPVGEHLEGLDCVVDMPLAPAPLGAATEGEGEREGEREGELDPTQPGPQDTQEVTDGFAASLASVRSEAVSSLVQSGDMTGAEAEEALTMESLSGSEVFVLSGVT
ncbi:hypothetical protein KIPB_002597 [Kipferlia bialata]|uniref:Uncharacterized protein n=1 Tax=Kipferlia bialata TaxID=797122 RepID=A0A9K3GGA7_9EUKA|nr:hypothetical protein KIPB_002597 [Kipferlia bialata]|eukprot:g2597.t1